MNAKRLAPLLLAVGFALAGCASTGASGLLAADAPRALPGSGPVTVAWTDPAEFSELKYSGNRFESARGEWLTTLAEYLRDRAQAQLPAGERLELTITDVQRAGRLRSLWSSSRSTRYGAGCFFTGGSADWHLRTS